MRRALLVLFALTTCAFADTTEDGSIVLSPAERRALVQKMTDLQDQIDDLTEQLIKAKEKFNVAHNCA